MTNLALAMANRVSVFRACIIIAAHDFRPIRTILNEMCDLTWILKAAGPPGLQLSAGTAGALSTHRCKLEPYTPVYA
jgi:hypothetical protein